jgi:hypothetical protein
MYHSRPSQRICWISPTSFFSSTTSAAGAASEPSNSDSQWQISRTVPELTVDLGRSESTGRNFVCEQNVQLAVSSAAGSAIFKQNVGSGPPGESPFYGVTYPFVSGSRKKQYVIEMRLVPSQNQPHRAPQFLIYQRCPGSKDSTHQAWALSIRGVS